MKPISSNKRVTLIAMVVVLLLVFILFIYYFAFTLHPNPKLHITLIDETTDNSNWTIRISEINNGDAVELNKISITILYANLTIGLNEITLFEINGTYINGVIFSDNSQSGQLDVGDQFVIDQTKFAANSKIILRIVGEDIDPKANRDVGEYTL